MASVRSLLPATSLIVALSAVTLFGCGGGTDGAATSTMGEQQQAEHPSTVTTSPAARTTGAKRAAADPCRSHKAARAAGIEPAHMLPPESSPFGGAAISPVRNGWAAGDRHSDTAVFAGGKGSGHPITGKFLIIRHGRSRHGHPGAHSIYVDQAGVLKITKAPLGCRVVTWAQKRGELQFTSTNGVTGTLHLKDDSVTLDP